MTTVSNALQRLDCMFIWNTRVAPITVLYRATQRYPKRVRGAWGCGGEPAGPDDIREKSTIFQQIKKVGFFFLVLQMLRSRVAWPVSPLFSETWGFDCLIINFDFIHNTGFLITHKQAHKQKKEGEWKKKKVSIIYIVVVLLHTSYSKQQNGNIRIQIASRHCDVWPRQQRQVDHHQSIKAGEAAH
jgi:hypothetical protein